MRRLGLAVAISLSICLSLAPLAGDTQQAGSVWRIGFVGFQSPGLESRMIEYFRDRLVELGYVDGHNTSISYRWADGKVTKLRSFAVDLVRSQDVIVAPCGPLVQAIRELHVTIPVVVRSIDAQSSGSEIAALDMPGGYTTGAIYFSPDATARRLEILKTLIPGLSRVGVLYRPTSDWSAHWGDVVAAARAAGLRLHRAEWKDRSDLAVAFDAALYHGVGAVLTLGDGVMWSQRHDIFEMAALRGLPVLYDFGMFPAAEVGLISYSVDSRALFRHVADQVDQILKGTKPGDIPIGRPRQFRLYINHDAAKTLGLKVPQSLLLQTNKVIE